MMERGSLDTDGTRHTAKAAWRVLALLQIELELAGAPQARGSTGVCPEIAAQTVAKVDALFREGKAVTHTPFSDEEDVRIKSVK